MSAQGAPGRLEYAGDEIFFQTLCEQVDSVYRSYRMGQLRLDPGIQRALEHVSRLLAGANPQRVGPLTALRARIACAQADEMLAVLQQFNGVLSHSPLRELCVSSGGPDRREDEVQEPVAPGRSARQPGTWRPWWAVAAVVALALFGYLAVGNPGGSNRGTLVGATLPSPIGPPPAPIGTGHTLGGELLIVAHSGKGRVTYTGGKFPGQPCTGAGGYSDVRPGEAVTVSGISGRPLASGRLGPGLATLVAGHSSPTRACGFRITVPDIPTAATYRLSFGAHRRAVYSYQRLAASDWSLSVTLGQ